MLRRALTTLVLVTVLVAACGEAASIPCTTSAPVTTAPPTTIATNPESLDDLAGAYTVPAAINPRIFSGENPGYSGDLLVDGFDCDVIRAAISYEVVACAEGGTAESPFIVVVGDEYVERDEATDTATVSLQ